MNDEIKEILDKLKETVDYPKLNYSSYDKSYNETIDNVAMIKSFACKQLLDYITNLQKENEDYKSRVEKAVEYINKYEVCLIKNGIPEISRTHLLNILQNGSDEE